jgi:hypothetical protein
VKYIVAIALVTQFVVATPTYSQTLLDHIARFTLNLFLPEGYAEGLEIRSLLRSTSWQTYRQSVPDTTAMNTIFALGYLLCDGKSKGALLATSISVLDHKTIPVKFLFGLEIDIPLTIETQQHFDIRTAQLPSRIYSDSIEDRDKLQHFFFSAYLKRTLGMNWLCNLLGSFIEGGEDLFIIGGVDDPRDRQANADGIIFATKLGQDSTTRPSTCLK